MANMLRMFSAGTLSLHSSRYDLNANFSLLLTIKTFGVLESLMLSTKGLVYYIQWASKQAKLSNSDLY